jgi:hypothetical protein
MYDNVSREAYFPFQAARKEKKRNKRELMLVFVILLLIWALAPLGLRQLDQTAGSIDQSIWLLVLLGMICFLLLLALCWWLLQIFWTVMQLPSLKSMVLQFNTLTVWQQLSFYWASFFLLLLAAMGCLCAVC